MHADCIREIELAVGRRLKPNEANSVEQRILSNLRQLARTDKTWPTKSKAEQLQAAADKARAEDIAAADKQAQRRASNLLAQARESSRLLEVAARKTGSQPHHAALFERLRQLDNDVTGVRSDIMSDLIETIDAIEPRFLGLMDDPASIRDFVREVYGQKTGNPIMAKGAEAYLAAMERARQRSNAAGTDIGKLDYGYLPQNHNVGRIARAGKDAWVAAIAPKLARERYVLEDGQLMDDAALTAFLGNAYDTLATEGRNKLVPGQTARGSRAARFDDAHRALHFKDADSYLAYMAEFGRGGLLESIHGHVGMIAKNIALMDNFGANPNGTYKLLKDMAEKGDNRSGATEMGASADMVWDTLTGVTQTPVSPGLARFFQGVRNFTTAVKLQSVMLSAITDAPLQMLTARYNGVPLGRLMTQTLKSFSNNNQRDAQLLGIGIDEITGEMARWHTDNLAQGWTSKLANTTMKLTLIDRWSHALRRGHSLALSGTLHDLRATGWDALSPHDLQRMQAAGVTPQDWAVWQMAEPVLHDGAPILSKEGIRAIPASKLDAAGITPEAHSRAIARLLGLLDQEAQIAVLTPDIQTRAAITQGIRSGTLGGELWRCGMLFKSFGVAIVQKHLRRIQSIEGARGKTAYSAAMMVGLTTFGAMALQLKDLASGKDPRNMTTGKFWAAAFLQGGGFGIFGDILYTGMGGNARGGQANWTGLLGPVLGTAFDAASIGAQAAKGEGDKAAAETVRFAKGNTPFVNLWYLRAATDHLVFQEMQEALSPGYQRRLKARSKKDWGQDYWWAPGEQLPDRAPDLQAAAGN